MAIGRTHMISLPVWPKGEDQQASCRGEGRLWDDMAAAIDHTRKLDALWERTQDAIPYCRRCPITSECYRIAESDQYSGVAGGYIFKDGLPVAPLRVVSQESASMSA